MIIKNKKASFEYTLYETYISGILLVGSEIKSIREGKVSLNESYCAFINNELFLINSHITEYKYTTQFKWDEKRNRKLLLTKQELKKIKRKIEEKGFTLIPVNMFINEKGKCKVTISIAKGKKTFDKKQSIKEKDLKRELEKYKKF